MNTLSTLVAMDVAAPKIEYGLLAPLLIVFLGACVGVVLEAVLPRHHRRDAQALLAGLTIAGALGGIYFTWHRGYRQLTAEGSVMVDGPALAAWVLLLVFGGLSLILFAERRASDGNSAFAPMAAAVPGSPLESDAIKARIEHTEVYPLLMFSLFGMMLFAASADLLVMFVALEVFSLPLYLLSALARRRRLLSQEAGLKYFLLGSLSSALFLYGMALLYGYSGSFSFSGIDTAIAAGTSSQSLLLGGLGLVSIGLLFKMGAVPFHSWVPDVYMGAPTPVTAFMAICTKIAAVIALMRVLYAGLGAVRWDWQPLIAILAVLTMLVGAVLLINQTDVKRMLAYSSIAHAGFILTAVAGGITAQNGLKVGQTGSVGSVLFYLAAYGAATIGAFALLVVVRKAGGEATSTGAWRGIGKRHPVIAGIMTLFMLSFAGIPLTAGFMGKLLVFSAAWRGGYWWLALAGVVCSVIAASVYLWFVVLMFFQDPTDEGVHYAKPGIQTTAVVAVCVAATVVLGVYGGPLMRLFERASVLLR